MYQNNDCTRKKVVSWYVAHLKEGKKKVRKKSRPLVLAEKEKGLN